MNPRTISRNLSPISHLLEYSFISRFPSSRVSTARSFIPTFQNPARQPHIKSFSTSRTLFAAMTDPSKYILNHTMLRVKDPQASIKFWEHLGMSLINKIDNPENKFCLYFLAFDGPNSVSSDKHWTNREGIIELTHNYGTEDDPNYKITNGNTDPHKGLKITRSRSSKNDLTGRHRIWTCRNLRRQHPGCMSED